MRDDIIREVKELICKATALAMERIQQGKYNPPTIEELTIDDTDTWLADRLNIKNDVTTKKSTERLNKEIGHG